MPKEPLTSLRVLQIQISVLSSNLTDMNTESNHRIKLGIFIIIALVLLVAGLYLIGKNKNFWGKSYSLTARFDNVGGLQPGNNVRYAGIDVGTVDKINILNDTTIEVVMFIENNMQQIIRNNSAASIGTDGLMGNKLINIEPGTTDAPIAEENDILPGIKAIDTEQMLRTLESTNKNIELVSANLIEFTNNINKSRGTLYTMLMDTTLAGSLHNTLGNIEKITLNLNNFSLRLSQVSNDVKKGKGVLGALVSDTGSFSQNLNSTMSNLQRSSKSIEQVTEQLQCILKDIENGKGSAGKVLKDTVLANHLARSIEYIDSSAFKFNENMEALKSNFLLRRYFKKKK